MAKSLGLDKVVRFFQIIKDNGGIFNSIRTLYRMDTLKSGTLVGVDKFGNKYYENNRYFYGTNRWVVYSDQYGMDYDGSQIPAEWFGWMHYKTDLLPHEDPTRPKYKWMAEHKVNLSGTDKAYMPYTTTPPKIEAWKPPQ
ncbi:probable NADH dehydrogenase [ubiquinone] 1 alpha subcomplex subunit 12 [Hylaeus volcanicus]|uniref:probable NADH dehydrogenase [ubiquinone] 1 alpha subcomplex subunit 12 n=1 Tax=Hylaeus volcanicus TaxID=313075 RepID=UPI0023B78A91|nr:probable NADH dehydrogenase [ubiquinone] 1 alpha subcomplex subunit 12 [Hylaeus volcanicus]